MDSQKVAKIVGRGLCTLNFLQWSPIVTTQQECNIKSRKFGTMAV